MTGHLWFDVLSQFIILTFGVTALLLSQLDSIICRKAAPIIGITAEPFWMYSSYLAGQWGIFILAFVYMMVWMFTFYKVWIKKSKRSVV